MKYEWKKEEKKFYLPKDKPELVEVPEFQYLTISGAGNPNEPLFAKYVEALYSLSYTVKMSPKKNSEPNGYFDYSVYPLEGIWDIKQEAQHNPKGPINKQDLVFKLMIKQPPFVTGTYMDCILDKVASKTKNELILQVKLENIADGKSIQILHVGSYDDEPKSFKKMDIFAREHNLNRIEKSHREIYLSDARKVDKDKLKTVLRVRVE